MAAVASTSPPATSVAKDGSSETVHSTGTSPRSAGSPTRVQMTEPSGAGSPAMTPSGNGIGSGTPGGGRRGSTGGAGTAQAPSTTVAPTPKPSDRKQIAARHSPAGAQLHRPVPIGHPSSSTAPRPAAQEV